MSPATPWTELTGPETGYVKGIPTGIPELALFGVFLMTTTGLTDIPPTPYTKMSVAATTSTEMTAPSTTWTEVGL